LTGPGLVDHLQSTNWWQDLDSDCAVITIGSPYVSYASIRALGMMLDVDAPFEKQEFSSKQELPIRFYCPAKICKSENAFTINRKQLKEGFPSELASMDPGDRALVIGNQCFIARPYGESINPIVAQYRNGHLRVVFSAIFAPATAGIAELAANRAIMHMPDNISSDNNKVMIALVKTRIKHRDTGEGLSACVHRDSRELVDQHVFYERIWSKADDGRWRAEPGDEQAL
jgi:hypothetical protein